jgi:hypothetical protein
VTTSTFNHRDHRWTETSSGRNFYPPANSSNVNHLSDRRRNAEKICCRLLIGVSSGGTAITKEEYASVHIHKNHAFSILAAHALTDGSGRFVLVRDPHSHSQYREASVTKDVIEQLRRVNPAHRASGAFWISWKAFLRYFSSLTISTYNSDHFDMRQRGEFTRSPTQCVTTYQFQLNE